MGHICLMHKFVICFLLVGCASTSSFSPALSDIGIQTSADGLIQLAEKVRGREDAQCFFENNLEICPVRGGQEVYTFARPEDDAYPAILFQGYVDFEDTIRLEERGWFGGNEEAAQLFFKSAQSKSQRPQQLLP